MLGRDTGAIAVQKVKVKGTMFALALWRQRGFIKLYLPPLHFKSLTVWCETWVYALWLQRPQLLHKASSPTKPTWTQTWRTRNHRVVLEQTVAAAADGLSGNNCSHQKVVFVCICSRRGNSENLLNCCQAERKGDKLSVGTFVHLSLRFLFSSTHFLSWTANQNTASHKQAALPI